MNEEMNNNYNNTPNYNYEKNNSGVKVLLIILIVLAVAILGLLSYKIFVVDKKNYNKKDNNVIENNNSNGNDNIVETNDDNKTVENSNQDTPIINDENENTVENKNLTIDEKIKKEVLMLPLNKIIDKKSYKDIYEGNVIYNAIKKLKSSGHAEYGKDVPKKDKNGKEYPNYSDKTEYTILKQFGLTVEEIEKANINLMEGNLGGQINFDMYDANEVVDKVKELYDYDLKFNESKNYGGEIFTDYFGATILYDSGINKFIFQSGGGVPITGNGTIIDSKHENEYYKIDIVYTAYSIGCTVMDKNNNEKEISCEEASADKRDAYALSHKDELPQYEVSYKINSDNTYEFMNIKKVN